MGSSRFTLERNTPINGGKKLMTWSNMHLVFTAAATFLVAEATNGYSSTCTEDGYLEIIIPYANAVTASLLKAVAGTCDVAGPGGTDQTHTYVHDENTNQATLKLHIK